ncbi:hypothetical protein JNJ66_02310 [Candidatus Saccharibacteria bacterium]|nr:hypothetical protein [Candidatus Saccharibacteria bacterium]
MHTFIGIFLIAHGLIHASYLTPKPDDPNYPFDYTKGWFAQLAGGLAGPLGLALTLIVVTSFVLAGLGVLSVPGLGGMWKLAATVGAVASTVLLVLYWHPWLVLGLVINAVLLYGLHILQWSWR